MCNVANESAERCILCGNTRELYVINGVYICDECHKKFYKELKYSRDLGGIVKLVSGMETLLDGLKDLYNIDPHDANFVDTPRRVARGLLEMCYGSNIQAARDVLSVSFPSDTADGEGYTGLISANGIKVFSLCPHHMLPVELLTNLAYIPSEDGRCVGLSKLPRLCQTLAKQPMLQETYTKLVVDTLCENLHCAGAACMVKGVHNCIACRGVSMPDVSVTTSELRGLFKTNAELRNEWLFTIDKA